MPYRSGAEEEHLTQEGSVVDELVRQFADPYAFLRELVQNGIDAKARHISVRMERLERGQAAWSVSDDGVGMTLAIIEGPLLTAFSSSKEGDSGSIGKYGVGFLSVFGVGPREVRVTSWRAEGAHEVRLFPDQSFEVRELDPRPGHGTEVLVEHPVPGDGDDLHEERGEAALVRWCRHASCAIELHRPSKAGRRVLRIDRPMALLAPVVVEVEQDGLSALVGPAAGTERLPGARDGLEGASAFAGFYNRGLTLFESQDPSAVVAGVRFKVLGSGLSHTLSRDDVKRDRAHGRALELILTTARGPLREALDAALRESARQASKTGDFGRFDALLAAAWENLPRERVVVPIFAGHEGLGAVIDLPTLRDAGDALLAARDRAGAASDLVARGVTVVRLPAEEGAAAALANDLAAMTGKAVRHCDEVVTRLAKRDPRDLGGAADDLAAALVAALADAGEPVADVRFAAIEGRALTGVSTFALTSDTLPFAALPEHLTAARGRPGKDRSLVLDAENRTVVRAIRVADDDADVAAALLARIVLLEHRGAVSEPASDALLARAAGADR